MRNAIVLLSGGQDSTTCLFWALHHFDQVRAVGFHYGQRHARELQQAALIAERAGVPYHVFDVRGLLAGSALTDPGQDVSGPHRQAPDLPASFTAGRNLLFLAVAASYGHEQGITDLVTGVCQTDFSGYPDCRRVFVDSLQATLTLAMQAGPGGDFRIHTPLMYLTKADTWRLAKEVSTTRHDVVEIVRTMTITDYNGDTTPNEWGMGRLDNPASILRARGYEEAKAAGWV